MDYAKESLRLHEEWKGKIRVDSAVPVKTMQDLSLAYTPGVAQPCLEIQKDISKSYDLTRRWNICAVITDGSAVLGLGDIGPEAGMPVMEGKCVLFKEFGGVDAFPICVKTKDVDEFVNAVYLRNRAQAERKVRYTNIPRRPARYSRNNPCRPYQRTEAGGKEKGRGKDSNERRRRGLHSYNQTVAFRRF